MKRVHVLMINKTQRWLISFFFSGTKAPGDIRLCHYWLLASLMQGHLNGPDGECSPAGRVTRCAL